MKLADKTPYARGFYVTRRFKRRWKLRCAFRKNPRLLLLDEPQRAMARAIPTTHRALKQIEGRTQ